MKKSRKRVRRRERGRGTEIKGLRRGRCSKRERGVGRKGKTFKTRECLSIPTFV